MRLRYSNKKFDTISEGANKMANQIVGRMQQADPEWFTGSYEANGHPKTWGNPQYPDSTGKLTDFWPNKTKIDEFLSNSVPNGFNVKSSKSGMTVTFKAGNFGILTVDEQRYWTEK